MTLRLVILSGPANCGKMPIAIGYMDHDRSLALVSRDDLRAAFRTVRDEGHLTLFMVAATRSLLSLGYSVVVHAWNLEPEDRRRWTELATETGAALEWVDVPHVWARLVGPPQARTAP